MKKSIIFILFFILTMPVFADFTEFDRFPWGVSMQYVQKNINPKYIFIQKAEDGNSNLLEYTGKLKENRFDNEEYIIQYVFENKKLKCILYKPKYGEKDLIVARKRYQDTLNFLRKNNQIQKEQYRFLYNKVNYSEQKFYDEYTFSSQEKLNKVRNGELIILTDFFIHNGDTVMVVSLNFDPTYGEDGCVVHNIILIKNNK